MTQTNAYRCEFLGEFRLFGPEGQEIRVPVAKGAAIIAYLVLSGTQSVSRSVLIGLLWSERSDSSARRALRQCLHQMKNRLDEAAFDLLEFTPETVRLKTLNIETDINQWVNGTLCRALPEQKFDLTRMLHSLEDLDPAYSEWIWEQRRHQKQTICKTLLHEFEVAGDEDERLKIADKLHQLDPSLEVAARPLIDKNIRSGNIVELLSIYQRLWEALDEEWEERPSQELQELVGNARARLGESLPVSTANNLETPMRRYVSALAVHVHIKPDVSEAAAAQEIVAFLGKAEHVLTKAGALWLPLENNMACAFFGLPKAHEHDVRNAVTAALQLQRLFFEEGEMHAITCSIGLDAGLVDIPKGHEAAVAPSSTVVANAQSMTRHGAMTQHEGNNTFIHASWHMVRQLEHLFDFYPVRSADHHERCVKIIGPSSQAKHPSSNAVEGLIGRLPFIAALRTAWEETQENGFQTISLQGPAGIGKTRLAMAFLEDKTHEIPVLAIVRCNRYDRSAPLEPAYHLLNHVTGKRPQTETNRDALLSDLIEALGQKTGIILIDDWHWADDASRSIFQDLVIALQDCPILLILTARDASLDDGLMRTSHQLSVPPLNGKEAERRAEQVLGHPIDATLKAKIYERSGGNPLYLEEICRALNTLDGDGKQGIKPEALAADLHALIASRVDLLDDENTKIIFAIAAYGESLDLGLLSEVLGHPVQPAHLERLYGQEMLRADQSGNRLQFKHGITRDVTYALIPAKERVALHARYFKILMAQAAMDKAHDRVEHLALHAQTSGNLVEAIGFSEQAGDKALLASSLDQAERQLHTALTLIEKLDHASDWNARWLSIALRWARPCVYAASADHMPMLEKAQTLAEGLGDTPRLAELLYWTGYNLLVQGEYEQAQNLLERSKKLSSASGLDRLKMEVTAILGYALTLQSHYEQAKTAIEMALGAKDKNPVRSGKAPVTSVYLQSILALIDGEQGQFDKAEERLDTALARIAPFHHEIESSILTTGTTVLLWRERWAKAREFARRARQRSERVSAPYMIGTSRCLFSYADWKIGKNPNSLAELQRTAQWLDRQGMRLFLTLILGWLSDALADAERYEEAASVAHRALERTQESGESLGASLACRTLARCAMAPDGAGYHTAIDHIREARRWARHRGADHEHAACALLEAQIELQEGHWEKAGPSQKEAIALCQKLGMETSLKNAYSLQDMPHAMAFRA